MAPDFVQYSHLKIAHARRLLSFIKMVVENRSVPEKYNPEGAPDAAEGRLNREILQREAQPVESGDEDESRCSSGSQEALESQVQIGTP